jgi:hypothetical protein
MRWADPGDLKRCILRSRRRVGWCEFSARLFCVPWQGASFSPVEIRAGKLSLQPEAIGADQEATNDLKPSDEGCTKYVRDGEAFLKADFVAEAGVRSLLCLKSANS